MCAWVGVYVCEKERERGQKRGGGGGTMERDKGEGGEREAMERRRKIESKRKPICPDYALVILYPSLTS